MAHIRQPAVAGMFYPANPDELHGTIARYLAEAEPEAGDVTPPKAIIAPHAGYPFSGPVAARTYAHLRPLRGRISRVVLLGPSHRVAFAGLATSRADFFRTPLGDVAVDRAACEQVEALPQVQPIDQAHLQEHSLEVHLPFLQEVLGEFALVPLVVGDAEAEQVAEVLDMLWGGEETLIVISSDLSHYHDYVTARERDSRTSEAIRTLRYEAIDYGDACGRNPINGLLAVARRRGMSAAVVDTRNSGDTAGPRDRVVGYGAYEFRP